MKRTHLPLNGLRVLDAAARHLSFTRAADELAVTPAAVGQQIRALEDTLGAVLFRRTTRGLELTPEAEAGLGPLRDGFLQFEEAVRAMQAGQSSKSLTIAAPRDVTEKWLMARLADIAQADPDMRFVLLAADETLDFAQANLDLAIRWGEGPGAEEGEAIEADGLVTVAAPVDAGEGAIAWPGAPDSGALLTVADAGLAVDAAAAGLGRATVPELVARTDLAAGRVVAVGEPMPSPAGYWLVAPVPQWRQKKVKALVAAPDRVSDVIAATFASARLAMRPIRLADAEALHHAYRDPELMRWWSSAPQLTIEDTRAYLAPREGRDWQSWAITLGGADAAIGTLAAHPHRERVWEIGYLLVRDHWGQGYAGEAVTALIDLLFGRAGARRVYADVDPDNARSLALLEQLGFQREGLLRAEWETHIGVRDSVILGLLADEWVNSSASTPA